MLLRVFDIGRVQGDLEVALDARHARSHDDVFIGFVKHGRYLGTHAYVVGDEGRVLLAFPWVDRVNWLLALGFWTDELPVDVGDEGWEGLEQGWWASVLVRGPDIYLAETDLDRIHEVSDAPRIECFTPGTVSVDDVDVSWNVVLRQAYDDAWRRAIRSCRRFKPSPVGEFDPENRVFTPR